MKTPHIPAIMPPPLKRGGTVGLISPGRWPEKAWIDKAVATLEHHGYQAVTHAQNYLHDGQLAGSDAARVEAIHDMFIDTTIHAVLCCRGGTGSLRLLELLDYKLIAKNPKPFIGFSDITVLLQAITKQCGFVTYHGPMGWNFAHAKNNPRTIEDFFNVITAKKEHIHLHFPDVEVIRTGHADGILTGGNITLLQHLIGTPYDWSADNAILFIEDVDEALYKIDLKLKQFRLAGKFDHVRAVLVGEMVDMVDGETGLMREGEKPYGRDLKQIIMEHVPPEIPLAFNVPCGHGGYISTFPVGAAATLTLDDKGAVLTILGGS